MGHAKNLPKLGSAKDLLLPDSVPELEIDEEADTHFASSMQTSFEELVSNNVNYDMIIWLSVSLLLVLAWGIGIIMLLICHSGGLHTFKIESIAHGKAASVDELRVQGVHNPGLLRKVIITQASKSIQDGRAWNPNLQITGGESMFPMESSTLGPAVLNSPSKGWKTIHSPRHVSVEPQGVVTSDLMLHKLDEVSKSVRKLEFLVEKNQVQLPTSCLQNV